MGVATRGVKFKFAAGEKVLCYEPDPTKAKVLYESKVLDLVVSRDERGRKVPEYLIHFFGWNSSWDRCVREEFILPFTEENRELQVKLANEAALSIKGKRKSKLPPLLKETLYKKQCNDSGNEKSENPDSSSSESDSESSEEDTEKDVILKLPEILKEVLEDDWLAVTKKNKLVKLPCRPNVIAILEDYVKHLAAQLLCASPPKNTKNGKQIMPDDVKNKLNLCKEVMDGIRVYFDFTLPHLLLYRQEKKQYYTDGTRFSPLFDSFSDLPEKAVKIEVDTYHEAALKSDLAFPGCLQKSRISRYLKSPSAVVKTEVRSSPEAHQPAEKCFKRKRARGRPRMASTRILRSSDKPKQSTSAEESAVVTNSLEMKPCPSSETRLTRKSTQQATSSDLMEKSLSASRCPSTTDSSGLSTASVPKLSQQCVLINDMTLLQEIFSWRILPQHFYEQIPAAPSLIYGAHHLLRLLVKLPEMISKMSLSTQKLQNLMCILENFLMYVADRKGDLFHPATYIDSSDSF
ncbi:male-specific lethal 3 homolog [Argiope bruennichi]|uniref:male-specific lethal 3 homolog n=1 Tax=Argiope bruennichi TaxID=94029 RepID=UPI002494D799|nr:male-specific lethal 3 homolog [Argiope bruennichi]XP_055932632.1 male-specific lethal 3 homolog [Argiope bruennichi]